MQKTEVYQPRFVVAGRINTYPWMKENLQLFVSIHEDLTTKENKRAVYTDKTTNWITAYIKFNCYLNLFIKIYL